MEKPYKTVVKGRTVFLCCDSCEKKLQENSDKYLAKLDAAAK
jgi:YHS domain-containing protein